MPEPASNIGSVHALGYIWDQTLNGGLGDWVAATAATSGGGAVSIADGADVAEGARADAAWSGSGSGTVVAILKRIASVITASDTPGSPFDQTGPVVLLGAKRIDLPTLDILSDDGYSKNLITDQYGYLRVTLGQSVEANPVRDDADIKDNDPWVPTVSLATVVGGEVDDVSPASLTEGRAGAVRMSPNRSLYGQIRDAAGNERGVNVSARNALQTDWTTNTLALEFDGLGNPIYIGAAIQGSAKSAAVWQIRQFTYDGAGDVTDIQFAGGSPSFTNIWNNRASLSYS